MSKVVRLNDKVCSKLDQVKDFMMSNFFKDDETMWHFYFDDADSDDNTFIQYCLDYFLRANS